MKKISFQLASRNPSQRSASPTPAVQHARHVVAQPSLNPWRRPAPSAATVPHPAQDSAQDIPQNTTRNTSQVAGGSAPTTELQYLRPLREEAHEIRLLNIAPADALASPLRCELICVSLDDNPSYHALSYTWGKPFGERHSEGPFTPTYTENILHVQAQPVSITDNLNRALRYLPLQLQDQRVRITDNLNSALRYLRSKDETLTLWVDAICINQKDDVEKTGQVQQMTRIYQQAASTFAWLGPPADDSCLALATLCGMRRFALRTQPYRREGHTMVDMDAVPDRQPGVQQLVDEIIAASFGVLWGKEIESDIEIAPFPIRQVAGILGREYWGRIWILQELVLSPRVIFVCGSHSITTPDADEVIGSFFKTWDVLAEESGRAPYVIDHRPWTMINARLIFKQIGELQPLRKLLEEGALACLGASEPRDNIYALLNLANDGAQLGLKVDYSPANTYQKLYTEVAKAYLRRGELWFLSYCNSDPEGHLDLPSWVPNWNKEHGFRTFNSMTSFQTSNGTVVSATVPPDDTLPWSPWSQQIRLKGVIVDTIAWACQPRPAASLTNLPPHLREEILTWMRRTEASLLDSRYVSSVPSTRRAVSWIFVAGNAAVVDRFGLGEELQDELMMAAYNCLLGREAMVDDRAASTYQHLADCYFDSMMHTTTGERRLFLTTKGHLGIGSRYTQKEDKVAIFLGGGVPFVIREKLWQKRYRVVGEAWVERMMKGEAFEREHVVEDIELE